MPRELIINCDPDAAEVVTVVELSDDEFDARHAHEAADQLRAMRHSQRAAVARLRHLAVSDEVAACVLEVLGL
jgi:hypothetical protein